MENPIGKKASWISINDVGKGPRSGIVIRWFDLGDGLRYWVKDFSGTIHDVPANACKLSQPL